ncbi:MAG: heme-dependent peroxidase [Lactobacillus sp.]|jgi:chlorite dismutase|nr:heme-dependent peroxidase [Lactobacillus sp.]
MPEKPVDTLEGWYCLHLFWDLDWAAWQTCPESDRLKLVKGFKAYLAAETSAENQGEGSHYLFNVSGHKADLGLMILRPTLDELNEVETKIAKLPFNQYLTKTHSFVSITEVGTYTGKPKTDRGWAYVDAHLKPQLPEKPYICFYPMSKLRIPGANWYTLTYEQRQQFMHDHGAVGRKYAGKIWQFITGAIGLDDDEWGVTLFADTPLMFKKIITEMRYYEASSVYGEFPYFIIGTYLNAAKLDHLLLDEMAGDD